MAHFWGQIKSIGITRNPAPLACIFGMSHLYFTCITPCISSYPRYPVYPCIDSISIQRIQPPPGVYFWLYLYPVFARFEVVAVGYGEVQRDTARHSVYDTARYIYSYKYVRIQLAGYSLTQWDTAGYTVDLLQNG